MSLGAPQPRLLPAAQCSLVLCNHSHNAFALRLMAVAVQHWVLQSTRRLLLRSQVLATCKLHPLAGAMVKFEYTFFFFKVNWYTTIKQLKLRNNEISFFFFFLMCENIT
jgi:hypothetical protein